MECLPQISFRLLSSSSDLALGLSRLESWLVLVRPHSLAAGNLSSSSDLGRLNLSSLDSIQQPKVTDIACATKGGAMINFEKIEVANQLHEEYVYGTLLNYGVHYDKTWIYDKIHHEIRRRNECCVVDQLSKMK